MVLIGHDRRHDLGGISRSPGAKLYDEYLDEMVDESFGAWPHLIRIDAARFGTTQAFVLDVKAGVAADGVDRWPIVLDYGENLIEMIPYWVERMK